MVLIYPFFVCFESVFDRSSCSYMSHLCVLLQHQNPVKKIPISLDFIFQVHK